MKSEAAMIENNPDCIEYIEIIGDMISDTIPKAQRNCQIMSQGRKSIGNDNKVNINKHTRTQNQMEKHFDSIDAHSFIIDNG